MEKNYKVTTKNDVVYIESVDFSEAGLVKHGFSTRIGGVSQDPYSSMNLGFNRGDSNSNVEENHKIFANALGYPREKVVSAKQMHTANVIIVNEDDIGKKFQDVDGFVTNTPNIPLMTYHADCVPIFFLDPEKKVIALSHSGWKGTVDKIAVKTLEVMKHGFQCNMNDILIFIGPSICKDCYEVGLDVAELFERKYSSEELDKVLFKKSESKYHLDLWKANENILLENGIKKQNISICGICTHCHNHILFSHRAMGDQRGSLAGVIMLQ